MFGIPTGSKKMTPLSATHHNRRARKPRLAMMVALTMTGMLACLLLLASQTSVPQIARASGALVPTGSYQQIETMEGGLVQTVNVSDGQVVEAGQFLLQLENPDLSEQAQAARNRIAFLEQKERNSDAIERMLSAGNGIASNDVRVLSESGLVQAAAQARALAISQDAQRRAVGEQSEIVSRMAYALEIAQARVEGQERSFQRATNLHQRGLQSELRLQQEEDLLDELRGEAAEADVRYWQARKALSDLKSARENEKQVLLAKTIQSLTEDRAALIEHRATLHALTVRIDRLRIEAPAAGIVQSIAFANVGEVIAPGETLFELLPRRERLFAEVRVPTQEIGHIATPQNVQLTVDTYDARRFGKVGGELVAVSPVPLIDEITGASYFRGSVELASTTIGEGSYNRPLLAGMTVVAEMSTGENNLLAYFMKPVQSTLETAFNER